LVSSKVSIFWVNYNSSNFIDIVRESLTAIKELDYPNFELIIVDNGSMDGSKQLIENFIKKISLKSKSILLEQNLGFTGGNNAAFAARDPSSKYVVLLNNDAVPRKDSLKKMIEVMENDEKLGAVQGAILNYDERSIDTAGDYITELFDVYPLFQWMPPTSLKKSVYVTSADAAYSLFRVGALKAISRQGPMFDESMFAFFDDYMLGLQLWNHGFRIKALPMITAKHKRGASSTKTRSLQTYLSARNLIILNEISNSRYKVMVKLYSLRRVVDGILPSFSNHTYQEDSSERSKILSRALVDGIRMGLLKKKQGERIDIYKGPVITIKPLTALLSMVDRANVNSKMVLELNKEPYGNERLKNLVA